MKKSAIISTKIIKSTLFSLSLALIVGIIALLVRNLDVILDLPKFQSIATLMFGVAFLIAGIILRFWATLVFYKHQLKVVSMHPQNVLITTGPYRFSRSPLYVAVVLMGIGISLFFGSLSIALFSLVVFVLWNLTVMRKEERDLERVFGNEYLEYKKRVRRWL